MKLDVREATAADAALVRTILIAASIEAELSEDSVRDRIEGAQSGVLLAPSATLSWALDGASFFIYDVAGERAACDALLANAERLARARGGAVMAADVREGEALQEALVAYGFERDVEERDVVDGSVAAVLSYVLVL